MDEKNATKNQFFRFRFDPITLVVLILVLALCCTGFGLTTWQFIGFLQEDVSSVAGWIQYSLLYLVSVFLAAVVVAMLVRSGYCISDSGLILRLGFFKIKYPFDKIDAVKLLKGSNRLIVYLNDPKPKPVAIVIKDTRYDEFAKLLCDADPRIVYDFVSAEEEKPPKDKKK